MASGSPAQVHEDSLDSLGLSVVTSSKIAGDDRYGLAYEPNRLAAAVPVFFQPIDNTRYLAIFSQRWTAGVESRTTPGYYSAYTASQVPSWAIVDARTGATSNVGDLPMRTPHTATRLTAVANRSDFFWALNMVTNGAMSAVVQVFRRSVDTDGLQITNEETLPSFSVAGQKVMFNWGLYFDAPHLYFFGSRADTTDVYLARKGWGRIGVTAAEAPWEFQTPKGWSSDSSEAWPLLTADGSTLKTVGPVSSAVRQGRRFITTVSANGTARVAQHWVSRGLSDPWTAFGTDVPLGSLGSTYVGGGLYYQSQVPTSSVAQSDSTAFLAVKSVKSTVSSQDAILTSWSLEPVS